MKKTILILSAIVIGAYFLFFRRKAYASDTASGDIARPTGGGGLSPTTINLGGGNGSGSGSSKPADPISTLLNNSPIPFDKPATAIVGGVLSGNPSQIISNTVNNISDWLNDIGKGALDNINVWSHQPGVVQEAIIGYLEANDPNGRFRTMYEGANNDTKAVLNDIMNRSPSLRADVYGHPAVSAPARNGSVDVPPVQSHQPLPSNPAPRTNAL
jgi:hypothetical protein